MKAIVLEKIGGPQVLQVKRINKPSIKDPDEILIRMKFSGINYAEILARKGLYKWVPKKKGFILGMEGTGIVEEIGKDIVDYKVGDSVIVARGFGCHAEHVLTNEKYVFPSIPQFSLAQNAAFSGSFMTAYIALNRMARVRTGEKILVQAAAGALGTATLMLAKAMGMKVVGTCSTSKKMVVLEKLNVDLAINYTKDNFRELIMEWTENEGVDIVLESVGGKIFKESLQCLSPMGRLILVGITSVKFNKFNPLTWWPTYKLIPRVNLLSMLGKSQGILAFHVGRLLDDNYAIIREIYLELVNFVQENNIFPLIGKIFSLDEIADAHIFIESRKSFGKVLLQMD